MLLADLKIQCSFRQMWCVEWLGPECHSEHIS